jgi:hypothetical protein
MPLLGKVPWELDPPPSAGDEYWVIRFTNEAFGKYEYAFSSFLFVSPLLSVSTTHSTLLTLLVM